MKLPCFTFSIIFYFLHVSGFFVVVFHGFVFQISKSHSLSLSLAFCLSLALSISISFIPREDLWFSAAVRAFHS